jgi:hypothetical protein
MCRSTDCPSIRQKKRGLFSFSLYWHVVSKTENEYLSQTIAAETFSITQFQQKRKDRLPESNEIFIYK